MASAPAQGIAAETEIDAGRGGRAIPMAILGNALEWFDYTAYGFFAASIAHAYFPARDEATSILAAVAAFGAGFVTRPIGSVVLGLYADRAGRKTALVVAALLMLAGTATVALTPGYARIGILAPMLVVAGRLVQGFSIGGEFGCSTAYLIESSPRGRRGMRAGYQVLGQFAATLLATAVGTAVVHSMSSDQLAAWGWRIPFILGLAIGPVAIYLRWRGSEPSEFLRAARRGGGPGLGGWTARALPIFAVAGLTILPTAFSYTLVVYLPTYAARQLGVTATDIYLALACGALLGSVATPFVGLAGDHFGRRRIAMLAAIALGLLAYPLLRLAAAYPGAAPLAAMQAGLSFLFAAYAVPAIAITAALFPPRARCSGLSIGYTGAVAVFGGFAPLLTTWLARVTGSGFIPAYYVAFAAVLTVATLLLLPKRADESALET